MPPAACTWGATRFVGDSFAVARGVSVSADRVLITSGTSEGIELALTALANPGDGVLVPMPTYPLYTAVLAKIGARSIDDLFVDVPEIARLDGPVHGLPNHASELAVERHMSALAEELTGVLRHEVLDPWRAERHDHAHSREEAAHLESTLSTLRRLTLEAIVPNPTGRLKPGFFATARMVTGRSLR